MAGSILWLALWFFRLRPALAEKGWRHTAVVLVLPVFYVMPGSMQIVLRELEVIQQGGPVDTALTYTVAALAWIVLATIVVGMMLDAWRGTRQSA